MDFDKIEFSDDDDKNKVDEEDEDDGADLGAYYDEEADYGDEDDYWRKVSIFNHHKFLRQLILLKIFKI